MGENGIGSDCLERMIAIFQRLLGAAGSGAGAGADLQACSLTPGTAHQPVAPAIGLFHHRVSFDPPMPATPHIERHFTATETVRDVVIGMSDGLTVPFALAAGLSGAIASSHIVVTAGLAEIAAGSIAMGLGGYLAARTDAEHYRAERLREEREVVELPERETAEVAEIFRSYGLSGEALSEVVAAVRAEPRRWVDFMMTFELGREAPDPRRARNSALTIAASYIAGGLIPLAPYLLLRSARSTLLGSVILTLLALLAFGFVKASFTGTPRLRGALQTLATGGLAALAAYGIAKMIS